MPVKKTFRQGRRRRKVKRKPARSQLSKNQIDKMLNVHLHRRWGTRNGLQITANTVSTGFITLEEVFQLDKVTNYTELTALYDQYKINFVEIYMMWSPDYLPVATSTTAGERSNLVPPSLKIFHLPDYDDNDPLTLDEFKERSKTKLTLLKPQVMKKIVIKPAVLSQMYETLTSTGYAPKFGVKLDTNDVAVPHYCYKFGVEIPQVQGGSSDIELGHITYEFRYNLTMYNTK